jgi:hypothetical protein
MSNSIRRDVTIPPTIRDYNESWYDAFNRLNPGCPSSVMTMVLNDLKKRDFNVVRSYMMKQAVEEQDPNIMEVRAPVSAYERAMAESAEAIAEAKKAAAIEEQEGERLQVPLEKATSTTSTTSNKKVSFKTNLTNLTNSGGTRKNKKRSRRHKKRRGKKTRRHRSKHYKR